MLGDAALPDLAVHVWQGFLELSAVRGSNGWSPNALRHADAEAWMRVTRRQMRAYEVEWLFDLDRAYLMHCHAAEKKKADRGARR